MCTLLSYNFTEWNNELWGLVNINSNNNSEISCNIDFIFDGTLIDYVKMMVNYSDEIVEDDYGNLRYIGKNPNNYVSFNNELWRIIGVMKDIENADGTKEDKVKLIRSKSIGTYSWDSRRGSEKYIDESKNDWSDSALQKVLNEGAYWNRTSGTCPYGQTGATTACNFRSIGLTEDSKSMISESVWNLGGSDSDSGSKKVKEFYQLERGIKVYSGRPTKWTGKVGLMYPSDYGYATSGGATTDRSTCLNTSLYSWDGSGVSDCKTNDWLLGSITQWTLMPNSSNDVSIFFVSLKGYVYYSGAYDLFAASPSLYLNPDIEIESGGKGTSASPLMLKVN